jgi:hypothetical protein
METTLAPWRIASQVLVIGAFLLYVSLRPTPQMRILRMCIVAQVAYGMLQDQVSARLCPEYFTIAHPRIEGLENPTLLGIAWGFLGSWWGGLLLGLVLALAAVAGRRQPLPVEALRRPLLLVLVGQAVATALCEISVAYNARILGVSLGEPWASTVPHDRQLNLLVVACGHLATYVSAVLGGVTLCAWSVWKRSRIAAVITAG